MTKEFLQKIYELMQKGTAFAVATVVRTEGSSSARAGAKAIILPDGTTLFGWVGGGCVESAVAQEALNALKDGKTRLITLDLTDEVSSVGMPCGGSMQVYIEPFFTQPHLVILGHGAIAEALTELAHILNFFVVVDDTTAVKEKFLHASHLITDDTDYTNFPTAPETYVVVATQHKGDEKAIKSGIQKGVRYIALIASASRAKLVLDTLREQGISESQLKTVHSPAGLDLGAVTPEEIALSVLSQIVALRRGGSTKPLEEVKRPP